MERPKIFALLLLSLLSGCAFDDGRLVAETEISLAATSDGVPVLTLPAGTQLTVQRCVDTKHYVVPEVVDDDGSVYFVVDGKFHFLEDKRPWGC